MSILLKWNKVFLKEYEELMTEKTNCYNTPTWSSPNNSEEINELTEKLRNSQLESRNLKNEIKGNLSGLTI